MNLPGERPNLIRVGRFELDRRSRELCGGLARVRLQGQPFDLLERAGQLVTRDELRRCLWPDGTKEGARYGHVGRNPCICTPLD